METYDKFNRKGERNFENTATNTYNCGGYALGTYDWYAFEAPEDYDMSEGDGFDDIEDYYNYLFDLEEIDEEDRNEMLIRWCVNRVLNTFPDLHIISSPDDAPIENDVIAMRFTDAYENFCDKDLLDYHFAIRAGGCWMDKPGQSEAEYAPFEVDSEVWDRPQGAFEYVGPIIYFERVA